MVSQKHFVLVHGFCLGAWCWYKLVNLLKMARHRVTTLDLGGCGINPKRFDEIACVSDYVKPLMEFLKTLPSDERVVLVGHSYAGLCISLAMEEFPEKVLVAVFVTAYMPHYNSSPATLIQDFFKQKSMEFFMDCQFTFDKGPQNPATSALFGPEFMKTKMFRLCKPEELELAKTLGRPNGFFVEEFGSELLLTESKFGTVPRAFVVCEEDEVMDVEFQQYMINNNPPKQVKVIEGAGHMVMLSKPEKLCMCLQEIAENLT